jgi:hypothetical protein
MIGSLFALISYGCIFTLIEILISDALPIDLNPLVKNIIIGMIYFLLIKWILLYL